MAARNTLAAITLLMAMLSVAGPSGAAEGLGLSWDACASGGVENKSFDCSTDQGQERLVASFVTPHSICPNGLNAVLDLDFAGQSIPDWWQLAAGGCRESALGFDPVGTPGDWATCVDAWGATWGGGLIAVSTDPGLPRRLRMHVALSSGVECPDLTPGVHTYAFTLVIRHAHSTTPSPCTGCDVAACILLNEIRFNRIGAPGILTLVGSSPRNFVTWQGGTGDCPGATPARNESWGRLKFLYR